MTESNSPSDAQIPAALLEDEAWAWSASGIRTFRSCKRKAGYVYVDGDRGPDSAGSALGKQTHTQLEHWLDKKKVPDATPSGEVAKRVIPYLPSPAHPSMLTEYSFRLLFPMGAARGFIDLLVPTPEQRFFPRSLKVDPEVPFVSDHKTTGNIELATGQLDLKTDPQAILYGSAARVEAARRTGRKVSDVTDVDLVWNYVTTKGSKEVRPIKLRQTLPILEDGLGPLLDSAREFAAAIAHGVVEDLDYDLRHCDAYGGCPYKHKCTAHQAYVNGSGGTRPETISDYGAAMTDATSALLEKLRNAGKVAPTADPDQFTKQQGEVTTVSMGVVNLKTGGVKPSPEPALPKPDLSGLDEPIPTGTSPINSAEAAPDVTPEDPPVPEGSLLARITEPKKTRAKKPKAVVETLDATFTVSASVDDYEVLKAMAIRALETNNLKYANALIFAMDQ